MPIKKLISKITKKKDNESEKSNYVNLSTLTEAEREIIINTIELKSKSVREIMVPRVDVVMIPIEYSYDKVIKAFNKERNSRIYKTLFPQSVRGYNSEQQHRKTTF